jgi:hypothetical protein
MDEKVREQVTNVAMLPGIQIASMAMPDAHWGYGFPIGGVAAFDPEEGGIISMGGVGFDISCGVRTMKTGMTEEVMPRLKRWLTSSSGALPGGQRVHQTPPRSTRCCRRRGGAIGKASRRTILIYRGTRRVDGANRTNGQNASTARWARSARGTIISNCRSWPTFTMSRRHRPWDSG